MAHLAGVCVPAFSEAQCVFGGGGIVFREFGGNRRWIKRWISDLLAAAVTLVRWITTSHLWPHLLAPVSRRRGVWVCICVCVGGCAGQLYSCDRMRLVDQWPNEHCISLGQWSERWWPAAVARPGVFSCGEMCLFHENKRNNQRKNKGETKQQNQLYITFFFVFSNKKG